VPSHQATTPHRGNALTLALGGGWWVVSFTLR